MIKNKNIIIKNNINNKKIKSLCSTNFLGKKFDQKRD